MSYRRRDTALGVTRASAACLYCLALALAGLMLSNPLVLAAVTLACAGAGFAAGVGRELRRAARFAVPLMIVICAVNALAAREGLTVIARLGTVPVFGRLDITSEAVAYGGILGLRALTLILAAALYTATVDPDEMLKLFRRLSFRSALTATLATRMVPVLTRDAGRLADAQRCRPGSPPTRSQLLRATTANVLDRALDVAAALEVRGYSEARPAKRAAPAWSRHDLAFTASALAILAIAVATALANWAPFRAYPLLYAPLQSSAVAVALLIVLIAWLPFSDRRGTSR
jgi:energy-coupling factor transport system permease protein